MVRAQAALRQAQRQRRLQSSLGRLGGSRLLDGEDPNTGRLSDARAWVEIYGRLLAFNEDLKARERVGTGEPLPAELEAHPANSAPADLTRLRDRLDFWRERHRQLAPMDLDEPRRVLHGASGAFALTRRQVELLTFLLDRPGQFQSVTTLVARAWLNPCLAPEQVRSYVVKLRRLLVAAESRCKIEHRTGLGYRVVFTGTS